MDGFAPTVSARSPAALTVSCSASFRGPGAGPFGPNIEITEVPGATLVRLAALAADSLVHSGRDGATAVPPPRLDERIVVGICWSRRPS